MNALTRESSVQHEYAHPFYACALPGVNLTHPTEAAANFDCTELIDATQYLPFTLPTFNLKVVERQRDAKSLAELSSRPVEEVQGLSPKRNAFVAKITH
jgi:hypothetical protein